MKRVTATLALSFLLLIAQTPTSRANIAAGSLTANASPSIATSKALILYDSSDANYGKLGEVYAIMLRNLLGHFYMTADIEPVESYASGSVENYPATFYIGSIYDDPIPQSFLADVNSTSKTVVWFKYNLWQLAWNPSYNFSPTHGFAFTSLRGMNSQPSATNPNPGFFDTITYKGKTLNKYYKYDTNTGAILADPDFGATQITDATKATALVNATNSGTNEQLPYILRAGNFWYFADMPLSYIGPRDRYLVLCDILHDILGVNHPEIHRAMVRLEDVSATVSKDAMKRLTDFLYGKHIPFSIAVIPFYRDPLGYYNDGVPEEIHFKDATDLLASLNYAKTRGGTALMHGYTHQYDSTPNPWTAVSADDFEFWLIKPNTPVPEDSTAWASNRMQSGIAEMQGKGYTPFAWEVPHYQASAVDYTVFPNFMGANTYQRAFYYTSLNPNLTPGTSGRDFAAGMFYPYIIASDYYGQRVMPENLGNIEYDISNIDPSSNVVYTWQDILTNADKALVVRDGFGSFFFHPFWIEDDLAYLNAFSDFQNLVNGISALGYTWTSGSDLILALTAVQPAQGAKAGGTNITLTGRDFEPGATVTIGGQAATNVVVNSPTQITCTAPSGKPGKTDVTVVNPDGRSATLKGGYQYK